MGFPVKLSDEDIADFEVLRDIAIATVFGFLYMGRTSMCGGDAALCQITLTTCYCYYNRILIYNVHIVEIRHEFEIVQ